MYLSNPKESFKRLDQAVLATKTEQTAVNEVMRSLAALGMARAAIQEPEVHETRYDGSVLRIYLWRNTPYQDDLVLAAGPSFASKVALGEDVPASNEVGIFIRGVLLDAKPRSLRSADKVLDREERRAARAAAPRTPRAPRTKKEVATAAASAAQAIAEGSMFSRPGGRGYRPGPIVAGEEGAALGRTVAAFVKQAGDAAVAAAVAAAKAEKAAVKAERAKRERRPKSEVSAAVRSASAAAVEAETAAAKAETAAARVAEAAPSDAEADSQFDKLMAILAKKLGL